MAPPTNGPMTMPIWLPSQGVSIPIRHPGAKGSAFLLTPYQYAKQGCKSPTSKAESKHNESQQTNVRGLFGSGTQLDRIVRAPFWIPEVPMPAIARPTISMVEELAAAADHGSEDEDEEEDQERPL